MIDRIPCVNPDCGNTILPVTAELNEGLCMPCDTEIRKQAHNEYIRENRQDVDEFEGLSNAVEILKIIHKPRRIDPLVNWIPCSISTEDLYLSLNPEQAKILIDHVVELILGGDDGDYSEMLICLAAYTDVSLDSVGRILIAKRIFYPSIAFCRCSESIRDELIELVESDDKNRNLLLLALAWVGDEKIIHLFAEWKKIPPRWRDSLFIAPEEYAKQAGWELTGKLERRDLFFHNAHGLMAGESENVEHFVAIRDRSDICSWCSSTLINLFEFNPILLGIETGSHASKTLRIPTCQVCTAFGQYSGMYDEKGAWSLCTERPDYLPDDSDSWERLPSNPLNIGALRTAQHSADPCLPGTLSQIGGLPAWEQDAEYPECPKCDQTMRFVGQISHSDIEEYSEGIFYGFICSPCSATSTTYQQT